MPARRSLAAAAAAAAAAAGSVDSTMTLRVLPPSATAPFAASCLDGSPPAYYVRRSPTGRADWVVSLEGGAWCWQLTDDPNNGYANCVARAFTQSVGTSTGMAPTMQGSGMLDADPALNPRFHDYNVALIHYCDGGFYTSSNPNPVNVTWNGTARQIFFRGRPNLEAVFADLAASQGFGGAGAREVVLTGGSAGGQGVYFHVDWLRETVLNPNAHPGLLVTGVADAGMFLDAPDFPTGTHQYRLRLNTALPLWGTLAAGTLDASCLNAFAPTNDTWRCFFPQYSLAHISTPIFVANSATDAEQLHDDFVLGCCPLVNCSALSPFPDPRPACGPQALAAVEWYRDFFHASVNATLAANPGVGAFIDTCWVHVQTGGMGPPFWGNYSIPVDPAAPPGSGDRLTLQEAVSVWYDAVLAAAAGGGGAFAPVQLIDTAEFLQNPSCPYPPPPPGPPPAAPARRGE